MFVSHAKTTDPIEMAFGGGVLDGGHSKSHTERGAILGVVRLIQSTEITTRAFYTARKINKWLKDFDESPHRRPVTPRGGEWIRPTLTPSNTC